MPEDDRERTDPRTGSSTGARIADDLQAFAGVTADFYRGEMDRATAWRARLDQTTNWAVVVVAAILTWAFSGEGRPHYVILIGVFGVTAFLIMEANRYQEYDVWRGRVRTLQTNLFAEALDASGIDDQWRSRLSDELREPGFGISFHEALNHRLRRSYLALLSILLVAWIARVTVYEPDESWERTASILVVPGEATALIVAAFYVVVLALAAWSVTGNRVQEFEE